MEITVNVKDVLIFWRFQQKTFLLLIYILKICIDYIKYKPKPCILLISMTEVHEGNDITMS
jgi:hypothetical protein